MTTARDREALLHVESEWPTDKLLFANECRALTLMASLKQLHEREPELALGVLIKKADEIAHDMQLIQEELSK